MRDNRHSEEAARVREKSEFLKRVDDFARYMNMEYIDGSDDLSLMICAGDRSMDGASKSGMAHIMLGSQVMNTAALDSMLREDGFGDVMKIARLVNAGTDDDMDTAIRYKRRRLHIDIGIAVLLVVWTLCLIAMGVFGVMHWAMTLSNLALMAFTWLGVLREIRPLWRQVARLEADAREERKSRMELYAREVQKMTSDLIRRLERLRGEDDD